MIQPSDQCPSIWFTYGPSCDDENILRGMLTAGARGCRMTFSFAAPTIHEERAQKLQRIRAEIGLPCVIIADLAGEKVRLGNFAANNLLIAQGQRVLLTTVDQEPSFDVLQLPVTTCAPFAAAQPGDKITVGDGSLQLRIEAVRPDGIQTVALESGAVNPNRGLTLASSTAQPASLTAKDEADLEFILQSSYFDMIAISFVSEPAPLIKVQHALSKANKRLPIIAKIETAAGVKNIDPILKHADFVMAARGDLALSMEWVELPAAVEAIAAAAIRNGKPWILASQVVEGMERFAFPTRADICDVAHWLSRDAAGILLSYETAFGTKPLGAVAAVRQLIERWGVH